MIQAQRSPFRVKVSDFNPVPSSNHSDPAPSLTSRPEVSEALKTWQLTPGEWRRSKTSKLNLSPYPFKKIERPTAMLNNVSARTGNPNFQLPQNEKCSKRLPRRDHKAAIFGLKSKRETVAPSEVEQHARDMVKVNAIEIQSVGEWLTTYEGRLRVMNLGYLIRRDGKAIPVTAISCDPQKVQAYADRIAKTKGLVIAINADGTEIQDTYLCYAHKETPELGNKGQAAVLRKKGGKSLPRTFKTAIKREFEKFLPKSEVVAVKLNDMDRGQLKCEGLLAINGPRLAKGQRTEKDHVQQLGYAFDNAAHCAKVAGARSVTYTGISTGRFNFDPVAGGVIAMDCMISALVEGTLKQVVGAFWCGGEDNKVLAGSTAEGALARLFCSEQFNPGKIASSETGADMDTESSSEDSVDKRRIIGVENPWAIFESQGFHA